MGNYFRNIQVGQTSFWTFQKSYFFNPLTWFKLFFSKIASSWLTVACASCVTTLIWHLNATCTEWAHREMIYMVWITFLCVSPLADHSEVSCLLVSSNWWCQGKNSWPAVPRCPHPPAIHWEGKVETDSGLKGLLFWVLCFHSMLHNLHS